MEISDKTLDSLSKNDDPYKKKRDFEVEMFFVLNYSVVLKMLNLLSISKLDWIERFWSKQ